MSTLDQAFIRAYNKDRQKGTQNAASSLSKLDPAKVADAQNDASTIAQASAQAPLPAAPTPRLVIPSSRTEQKPMNAADARSEISRGSETQPADAAATDSTHTESAADTGRWYRVDAAGNLHTHQLRMNAAKTSDSMSNNKSDSQSNTTSGSTQVPTAPPSDPAAPAASIRMDLGTASVPARHTGHRLPPYPHLQKPQDTDKTTVDTMPAAQGGRRTLASYLAQNQADAAATEHDRQASPEKMASSVTQAPSAQARPHFPLSTPPTLDSSKSDRNATTDVSRSTLKMPAVGHFRKTRTDRPLVQETETAKTKFAAEPFPSAWEVDALTWPEIQNKLLSEQERAFSKVAAHFSDACRQGLQVLMVTSPTPGEGRSTVASCIARSVAQRGIQVALLDGDLESPSLADSLNLDIDQGWNDAIVEGLPLEEIAIHSLEDRLTLIPLTAHASSPKPARFERHIASLLQRLRESFDLIVIDATFINSLDSRLIGTGAEEILDAIILVADGRNEDTQRMETAIRRIRNLGISSVGIVENFSNS